MISINEDFELQWFTPSTVEWQQLRVHQYQFPVVDRAAPSLDMIDEALQVIQRHAQRKETVYIHCKSGQGRSATIVASYLIKVIPIMNTCMMTFTKTLNGVLNGKLMDLYN